MDAGLFLARFERKRVKHGIGKRNPYTRVTTIRVPNTRYLPDDEDHPPTGRTVRAHFRRGFVRQQHYGKGNELIKKVWIAPVFVNADGDWVGEPDQYPESRDDCDWWWGGEWLGSI